MLERQSYLRGANEFPDSQRKLSHLNRNYRRGGIPTGGYFGLHLDTIITRGHRLIWCCVELKLAHQNRIWLGLTGGQRRTGVVHAMLARVYEIQIQGR